VHVDVDDPDAQTVTVDFPSKGIVTVPWAYLTHRFDDGRDGGLAHAYALTAAKAQGSTPATRPPLAGASGRTPQTTVAVSIRLSRLDIGRLSAGPAGAIRLS